MLLTVCSVHFVTSTKLKSRSWRFFEMLQILYSERKCKSLNKAKAISDCFFECGSICRWALTAASWNSTKQNYISHHRGISFIGALCIVLCYIYASQFLNARTHARKKSAFFYKTYFVFPRCTKCRQQCQLAVASVWWTFISRHYYCCRFCCCCWRLFYFCTHTQDSFSWELFPIHFPFYSRMHHRQRLWPNRIVRDR